MPGKQQEEVWDIWELEWQDKRWHQCALATLANGLECDMSLNAAFFLRIFTLKSLKKYIINIQYISTLTDMKYLYWHILFNNIALPYSVFTYYSKQIWCMHITYSNKRADIVRMEFSFSWEL